MYCTNDSKKNMFKRKRVDCSKRVQFSTVTEYTFRVGYGSSSVPSTNAPGVGLIGSPVKIHTKEVRSDEPGCVMMYTTNDRLYLLQRSGLDVNNLANECLELKRIQVSRTSNAVEHIRYKKRAAIQVKETRSQMSIERLLC